MDLILYLSPELILIVFALLIFGLDLLWREDTGLRLGWIALVGMVLALFATLAIGFRVAPGAPGLPIQWGNQVALFCSQCKGGAVDLLTVAYAKVEDALFVSDNFTNFFRLVAVITGIGILLASFGYMSTRSKSRGEFFGLFLLAVTAMMLMGGSTNLLMIFLSTEFLSYTSYILTGYLRENKRSNEASIKYFLFGSITSAVMLYGMSIYYGATGSLNLGRIGAVFTQSTELEVMALFATALMMAGFGFKIALVPFHGWAPDAYEGAPTPVTAFLSIGPKAAGFAILIRVLLEAVIVYHNDWTTMLAILAVITMTLGNVVALTQSNVKRLLAYSSIAQAGYMLIGLAAFSMSKGIFDGLNATLIYIFVYVFTNLGAFLVVIGIENATGAVDISQYGGMIRRAPLLAVLMTYFMLSLAGIPPTAGFIGKFFVFGSALNAGLGWLAAIGVINSVISVFYYFRVLRPMFFEPSPEGGRISVDRWLNFGLIVSALLTLLIMLFPTPLINLVSGSATMFGLVLR